MFYLLLVFLFLFFLHALLIRVIYQYFRYEKLFHFISVDSPVRYDSINDKIFLIYNAIVLILWAVGAIAFVLVLLKLLAIIFSVG